MYLFCFGTMLCQVVFCIYVVMLCMLVFVHEFVLTRSGPTLLLWCIHVLLKGLLVSRLPMIFGPTSWRISESSHTCILFSGFSISRRPFMFSSGLQAWPGFLLHSFMPFRLVGCHASHRVFAPPGMARSPGSLAVFERPPGDRASHPFSEASGLGSASSCILFCCLGLLVIRLPT